MVYEIAIFRFSCPAAHSPKGETLTGGETIEETIRTCEDNMAFK
jgi:hypothetical protein